METVYVDTNVLFNWLVAKNATLVKPATDFMKDLSDGKFSGVISDLAINELFKAIRNTLVKDGKIVPLLGNKKKKTH